MFKLEYYTKELNNLFIILSNSPKKVKNISELFFIGLTFISSYYYILTISGFFDVNIKRIDFILIPQVLIISLFIAFIEELIFRYYIYNKLVARYNNIYSILITSYLYSQSHFIKFNLSFFEIIIPLINLFLFGIILSSLYRKKGIYASIGLHWSFILFISYINQTWFISPVKSTNFITGGLYAPNGFLTTIIFIFYLVFDKCLKNKLSENLINK